jgi:hypothetical protein
MPHDVASRDADIREHPCHPLAERKIPGNSVRRLRDRTPIMSTAIELESERKAADGGLAGRASGQHVEQIESAAQEDGVHGGRLTAEELAVEKKLLRKIDARIMPVVITIYLMNYIDRFVSLSSLSFLRSRFKR